MAKQLSVQCAENLGKSGNKQKGLRRINLEFYKQNYLDTLEQAEEVIKEGINAEYILSDQIPHS